MYRSPAEISEFLRTYTHTHYPDIVFDKWIYISISEQRLFWLQNFDIQAVYPISSAKLGIGNQQGSNQTPLGLHHIEEKHGEGVPLGGILQSRVFTGEIANLNTTTTALEEDVITSRILWLKGEEEGKNLGGEVDTYNRYIYLHGTQAEDKLGTPASHGCIRMNNQDIILFYNQIELQTKVLILAE